MNRTSSKIIVIVLMVIVLTSSVAVYVYMRSAAEASLARTHKARDIVLVEQSRQGRELTVKKTYSSTLAERTDIRNYFLSDGDAVAFIESLEKIGKAIGSPIVLTGIGEDNTDKLPSGSFAGIHAHVEANGNWDNVMRTLKLSEVLPYAATLSNMRLDMATISDGKETKKVWKLSYDITATVVVHHATSTKSVNK